MTVKSSTGLRNHLMDTGSFKSGMSGGSIRIFAGPAPADADAAETGTLLCVVTNNGTGTGLTFAAAATAGVLPKASGEVWLGNNVASGTATHYRLVAPGDTGTASTTEARQQGHGRVVDGLRRAGGQHNTRDVHVRADGADSALLPRLGDAGRADVAGRNEAVVGGRAAGDVGA